MDSKDPDELITEVQEEQQTRGELATEALQWFLDGNVGKLFPRGEVVEELSEELDINPARANVSISDTVGDIVDPVQQIAKSNEKYVGVIEYKVFNDEGAYGYVDFDDRKGKRKRVVCARCVEKHKYDENITHATQGEGSSKSDATWQQLLNKVTGHYADVHTHGPETVRPGASLLSGTTISGNVTFHQGNDGIGSGLDADTVDGKNATDLGVGVEESGSVVVSASTGINAKGHLNVTNDGDGTVSIDPSHNHDSRYINDGAGTVTATNHGDGVEVPIYSTLSDVPSLSEGEIVYVQSENSLYVEDGS